MQAMSAIAYIVSGLMTITLTHYKPAAYWNSRSRRFLRQRFGDRATVMLHEVMGAGLIAFGMVLLSKLEPLP
jgi:hypothetical protein